MTKKLRVGIAGLGTVGAGVVKTLERNRDLIAQRAGREIEVVCLSAQSKKKDRGFDLSKYKWIDKPEDIAAQDVDVVAELIGGSEGTAHNLVKDALQSGKSVVTANKALLAHHGAALALLAEEKGASLCYEAAVAGCVPVIRGLRDGLSANKITGVFGILNGTSNFILTQMRETKRDFKDVLKQAQEKGYAEADPTFDIEGIDAGHKLALLAALGFGMKPDFGSVKTKGIQHVTSDDIEYAYQQGYKIKLLATARNYDGKILQTVEPCMVPMHSPLGGIEDVYNGVFVEGDLVETPFFSGRGAGEFPTASAVVADLIEIARGVKVPAFGIPAKALKNPEPFDPDLEPGRYYMRLLVLDKPGVMADVSSILRDRSVSIEGVLQRGRRPDLPVPVMITTHETTRKNVRLACEDIAALKCTVEPPRFMRIEETL